MDRDVYINTGVHNHPSDRQHIYNAQFSHACKRRSQTQGGSLRSIYDECALRYIIIYYYSGNKRHKTNLLLPFNRYPDGAVTFAEIERSMLRARRQNEPPIARTVDELVRTINDFPRYR